jgi:hypothetical protein
MRPGSAKAWPAAAYALYVQNSYIPGRTVKSYPNLRFHNSQCEWGCTGVHRLQVHCTDTDGETARWHGAGSLDCLDRCGCKLK